MFARQFRRTIIVDETVITVLNIDRCDSLEQSKAAFIEINGGNKLSKASNKPGHLLIMPASIVAPSAKISILCILDHSIYVTL